ncbi:MAG: hypothetical protein IJJ85_04635 [Clostridia bacterium]|nr:hypothetical protein [Clostridia bacterium]
MASKQEFLVYKGYPLARSGKTIYYGNPYDPYIIMLLIASTVKVGDVDVADKVLVQLMNTDPAVPPKDKIVNRSEKRGLYAALDIANIWLQRANTQS